MKGFFKGGFHLPKLEEKVLGFWRTNRIFERSVESRKQGKRFVFFEGPPTANGKPGLHHVLARAFKDIIPRYKTMRGFLVERKGGWDTHGLPVELEVEKQLGLKSKKDIEKYGIAAFNRKCKESAWKYKDEWEKLTERMGFWLDLKNPYITYESSYIESLWWIIKEIWKKGLLSQGHKVVPWCPRCGTALSSHELAQGYKEVTDQSVYVKFYLKPGQKIGSFTTDDKTYILSWTTTPWTLPGNVALAVGKSVEYAAVRVNGVKELLILAKSLVPKVLEKHSVEEVHKLPGEHLVGLEYEPLFNIPALKNEKSYNIYDADFVTTEEGTGAVHTAVMYGEDDYELGKKVGLPQHHTVAEDGRFAADVEGLGGLPVKAGETEEKIFEHLKKHNLLLRTEPHTHEYPHCWRCGTPLLYYARTSWFVAMSKLRKELLKGNNEINWIPAHLKEGRFGEWLEEVKDWNFSRERYWGTPLPVWRCVKCGKDEVVGSIEELRKRTASRNKFLFMRHGEADNILDKICGPYDSNEYTAHLTARGREQVQETARALTKEGIDLIVSSPLARARESSEIVSRATGAKAAVDERFIEIQAGAFQGKPDKDWIDFLGSSPEAFSKIPPGGESRNQVKIRACAAFDELNAKRRGKKILIVSHGDALWSLKAGLEGASDAEAVNFPYPELGVLYPVHSQGTPTDEERRLDLHRPYIDAIKLQCLECGGEASRVKDVVDVWFDSGAMPFAQRHYPFEEKERIEKGTAFPADYIAEAMDQTRGWFYTLLAVSTLLGKGAPYKNVISLGLIHDKLGQKMSKSKGNVVDPWAMMEKYGIDAVRWYFYVATPPGESKNFDEAEIGKALRRFHLILYNSLVFFLTYGKNVPLNEVPANVLDRWILARLEETKESATAHLDKYEIREAGLALELLVDDLSRWYIRRSRRRFQPSRRSPGGGGKSEDERDYESASATLGHVLRETAKFLAPFTPFFAEALWGTLGGGSSVHLEDWPLDGARGKPEESKWQVAKSRALLGEMAEVRRLASLALAEREKAGIKVRQPLSALRLKKGEALKGKEELLQMLRDEANVKEIVFDKNLPGELELETAITAELREEGTLRDLVRFVQGLRQKAAYRPEDRILLALELPKALKDVVSRNEELLKREVGAAEIEYKKTSKFEAEAETKLEGEPVWIGVRKI